MDIKFKFLEYVKIKPLEDQVGRIVEIIIGQMVCYKVEYWVLGEVKTALLYEDELTEIKS